jgi:UPF0755 protein
MDAFLVQYRRSILVFVCIAIVGMVALSPPGHFPADVKVSIEEGDSAHTVSHTLKEAGVIRHPLLFTRFLQGTGQSGALRAGTYFFSAPENMLRIATRLTQGDEGLSSVSITFPEGSTVREMSVRVQTVFPHISQEDFSTAAGPFEGYLFPDTYLFSPAATASTIVETLRETFNKKIHILEEDIAASGKSLSDIVIMASLLEKEARTSMVRRTVAGILWERIALGMPLQVDAVFGYIFGRSTYSPSFDDLRVDSPYNTYRHRGLPPGPIANPGLESLRAALNPLQTEYLYYLTDANGEMHYAKTYAGHQENQRTYLK